MPTIEFTANLRRHVDCPPRAVEGRTVRAALEAYFAAHPRVRGYVLDEQGALRKHVAVFVGSEQVRDRSTLSDALPAGAEVRVIQALSGG